MVRAVAIWTWFVFVMVCVIGLCTLLTRPNRKPMTKKSEFHPRGSIHMHTPGVMAGVASD